MAIINMMMAAITTASTQVMIFTFRTMNSVARLQSSNSAATDLSAVTAFDSGTWSGRSLISSTQVAARA
jgi:hypothetical protein